MGAALEFDASSCAAWVAFAELEASLGELDRCRAIYDLAIAQQNLAELEQVGVPNYFGEQRFGKRGANLDKGLEIMRGDVMGAARRMPRRVFGLVLSAVQSEVFNRVIAKRVDRLGTVLDGDLATLHKNGATFTVEDPAQEQPRADALELSPSGPMPGPDMMVPSGEPLQIEAVDDVPLLPHVTPLCTVLGS